MAKKMNAGKKAVKIMLETREQMKAHERRFAPYILAPTVEMPTRADIVKGYLAHNLDEAMHGDIETTREALREKVNSKLTDELLWDLFRGIEDEYNKRQDEVLYKLLQRRWIKATSLDKKEFMRRKVPSSDLEMVLHSQAEGVVGHVCARLGNISLHEADYVWNIPVINLETGEQQAELEVSEKLMDLPE